MLVFCVVMLNVKVMWLTLYMVLFLGLVTDISSGVAPAGGDTNS